MSPPRMTEAEAAAIPGLREALRKTRAPVDPGEIDRLALKILGVLADATNNETRRRALEKARRMVGTR